ncbi:hypothetical protein [Paractinoplanes maris]
MLIRVEAAGVNFMDLKRRKGMPYDPPTPPPFVPGPRSPAPSPRSAKG